MLNEMVDDEDRVERGREVRPGIMAGPWEKERCKHGRWYVYRWVWSKGGNIECSTPEVGRSGCRKCQEED